MRRAFVVSLFSVCLAAGLIISLGAGDTSTGKEYKIVFDNAFGLVKGADFKVGGVPVGSIADLDVDRKDARALITVKVSKDDGFAGLRSSASCTINPQSLIGEYFVDCQPGKGGPLLKSGGVVPVKQTTSPIPPDLVLDITRRPVAQRFSIIFSELGVGFAARGGDVNQTIRRAIPALQTTDTVLKILARKRRTLANLSRESGQVLKVLGRRRTDITDFITQAGNAAAATAERREAVAETFRRFPGFLDQLTPTMRDLGTASREMAPALHDLRIAAPSVTGLLNTLRPFAQASQPAVTSLGKASRSGRIASREARSLVSRLSSLGKAAPEPAKNLRIILKHLDNRKFAVEKDPDSPGGQGYTGFEALLQYPFDQALALNYFDQRGYSLKINISAGECGNYTNAVEAKADPEKYKRCNQNLGPNQPGITSADPSATGDQATRSGRKSKTDASSAGDDATPFLPTPDPAPTTPGAPAKKPLLGLKPVQDLIDQVGQTAPAPSVAKDAPSADDLLDFLLKP